MSTARTILLCSGSLLGHRQVNKFIGPLLSIEIEACRNNFFESSRRHRQTRGDLANPASFFLEVPDKFTPGGLLRIALAVLGEDGDPRGEKIHIVRWNNRHALH